MAQVGHWDESSEESWVAAQGWLLGVACTVLALAVLGAKGGAVRQGVVPGCACQGATSLQPWCCAGCLQLTLCVSSGPLSCRLYDCDFNQQLELGLPSPSKRTVFDIDCLADLRGDAVAVGTHCFGCTAGAGSGCQGATSADE